MNASVSISLITLTAANADLVDLALSDGTPVEFVKITSKDRIQVRLPDTHALTQQDDGGSDPTLRIFRRDGTHFKNRTELTLILTPKAVELDTPAPVEAPAIPTATGSTYEVAGNTFATLADAQAEALDLFREDMSRNLDIIEIRRKKVATVGITTFG